MSATVGRVLLATFAALACAGAPGAGLARCAVNPDYQQSEALKRRYPDPLASFDTPAFAPGKTGYTSYEELLTFLNALAARADNVHLRTAGFSQELRPIPVLLFSNSGRFAPRELQRLDRPIVTLVGQLHGNEPAGGEAMLALARSLAHGELKPLLDRITVVIVPRANPDGAHYFWRGTAGCADVNRDHLKVDLPETAALRRIALELPPDVFVDAHEFSVATRWVEKFNAVQSHDVLMAYATHPNIDPRLTRMAERVFSPAVARAVSAAGYSQGWYYTTSYDLQDKRVSGGGTAPDIGRNYAGLGNALSFLVESRGVGIGRDSFARRVHTHYIVLASLLRTAAEHAHEVRGLTRAAREDLVRRGTSPAPDDRVAVTLKTASRKETLTMADPATGASREVEVDWIDPREAQPALTRARPYAYIVLPSQSEVTRRLVYSGIEVRRLKAPLELEVESYEVVERRQGNVFVEGHIRSSVTTEVQAQKRVFPAGTYVFPMGQAGANLLVAALEPESASSFVSLGIVPSDRRGVANPQEAAPSELPIYRLMRAGGLDTALR